MKKHFLILLILTLCFGCTANYKLKINEDLTVEENITGLENDEFYNRYYNSTKSHVVDFVIATKEDYLQQQNYNIKETSEENLYGATVSKTYSSIEDYYNNSTVYLQYYNSFNIDNQNDIITISLKDKLPQNGNSPDRYMVDSGTVSITLPFEVIDNNADKYDKKNNTYTWNVDSSNDKEIFIKFDSNKLLSAKFNFIYPIVFIFIVFVALFLILFFVKKNKHRNQV